MTNFFMVVAAISTEEGFEWHFPHLFNREFVLEPLSL